VFVKKNKISIVIPTYNRARYLDECLGSVVKQVVDNCCVEVVVCDNHSIDNTETVARQYSEKYAFVHYCRNENNLGYAGNQIKCIEKAQGDYIAILCDDDAYCDGLVKKLIDVIKNSEYAFVALNYYSFINNYNKKYMGNYAPEKDVVFNRAYDIMNHPSVGHFSGYVFKAALAKETTACLLKKNGVKYYEKHRGIINDVAVRVTLSTTLPSYYIGQRLLAARIPKKIDYDSLQHLCIDYYEYYKGIYDEGLITEQDLEYRKKLVLDRLPRAIMSNISRLSKQERIKVQKHWSSCWGMMIGSGTSAGICWNGRNTG
jgi:glycosyltransferase involved in cell wall biosynthesis